MGEGMRESSGEYCAGWDTTAGSNRPASTAEAGTFQVSYDSFDATPELKVIYYQYHHSQDRCLLDVYKEEAHCFDQGVLGKGDAAIFQNFTRSCPAFATDYALVLLRVLRTHFGPINRREAEVVEACNEMLSNIQTLVEGNVSAACQEF